MSTTAFSGLDKGSHNPKVLCAMAANQIPDTDENTERSMNEEQID